MNKPKLLSGEQLVYKCGLKNNISLPEIGLKDVVPNGSWLEQKQAQSALEGRKQLVEAERIEKCGALSHAIWREDLMLAEVTKQVGSYWQHLGHHMNKDIYLKPEEALYLIEVNCLQLKYNEVTVSLQQAYSLLLRQEIPILKYKVYASLSRLGYKVFRHAEPKPSSADKTKDDKTDSQLNNTQTPKQEINIENDKKADDIPPDKIVKEDSNDVQDTAVNSTIDIDLTQTDTCEIGKVGNEADSNQTQEEVGHCEVQGVVKIESKENQDAVESDHLEKHITCNSETPRKTSEAINQSFEHSDSANVYPSTSVDITPIAMNVVNRKQHQRKSVFRNKFLFKKLKPRVVHKYFKNIPEMFQKDVVTMTLPREHIPDNIYSEKPNFEINLKAVTTRQAFSPSNDTNSYSEIEESSTHARRGIESSSITVRQWANQAPFYASHVRFPRQPHSFNQFYYWRLRHTYNFYPYSLFHQRPSFRQMFYPPRFHFYPRPQPAFFRRFPSHFVQNMNVLYNNTNNDIPNNRPSNSNTASNITSCTTNSRKRSRDTNVDEQMFRLNCIKRLAFKLKMHQHRRDIRSNLIDYLQTQIQTYNSKYVPKIRLTDEMELVENVVIETITLEDNDVSRHKKARSNINHHYEEHLNNIKQLAHELKVLAARDQATPRHRRALSSVFKTFNKSFNADVYIDTNYEVVDRRNIVVVTSSDSDCIIENNKSEQKKLPAGKRLRNPFNVLKRLSEKSKLTSKSCSKEDDVLEITNSEIKTSDYNKYNAFITNTFSKNWLPDENDFGRAEIPPRSLMLSRLIDSNKHEFLYDFIKNQSCKFINWIDVKIMFLENMEAAAALFQNENDSECNMEFDSIIKPEDCTDMPSVLKKLSIIPSYKEVPNDTNLKIDFDVYNRDVKNLRKSDLPNPHFRIICLNESTDFPSGEDVAALHSKYDSSVPIIFAVVGQSISYLQIKPMDLPVYIPGSDTALED